MGFQMASSETINLLRMVKEFIDDHTQNIHVDIDNNGSCLFCKSPRMTIMVGMQDNKLYIGSCQTIDLHDPGSLPMLVKVLDLCHYKRCAECPLNSNRMASLGRLHTKQLLEMLKDARKFGGYFSEDPHSRCSYAWTTDEIKGVLAQREHVPNKKEAKEIRKKKAKKKGRKT